MDYGTLNKVSSDTNEGENLDEDKPYQDQEEGGPGWRIKTEVDARLLPAVRHDEVSGPGRRAGIEERSAKQLSLRMKDLSWEDMVIAYSTLPGYVTWRHTYRGTWFVESICKV